MKNFILLVTVISMGASINAQELSIDPATNKYVSIGIISIDSVSADILFQKTLEWIAINYNSANDVIQYSDKAASKIILKGAFSTTLFFKPGQIFHTATFEFKDGKMRYSYCYFSYYSDGSGDIPFEKNMVSKKKIFEITQGKISSSLESIKNYALQSNVESW